MKRHFLPLIALLISALPACSLRLNEPEPQAAPMVVKIEGQDCLANSGAVVQKYVDGKSTPEEIDAFWGCLDKSINAFLKHASGADPTRYSPRELANFVSKYFLNGRSVPEPLLSQMMRLKQGIFGGELNTISREEIGQILSLFGSFARVTKSLRTHMPLTPERLLQVDTSEAELEATMAAIEAAAVDLGQALRGNLGTYSVENFRGLLGELRSFFTAAGWETGWMAAAELGVERLPILKGIFVSPPKNEIRPQDWPRLMQLTPRYYGLYLRYKLHFHNPEKSFLHGEGLAQFVRIIDDSLSLLEFSLKSRGDEKISGPEIEELLGLLEKLDYLPYKRSDVSRLLTLAVNKFIPDSAAKGKLQFSLKNVAELRTLYTYFTEGFLTIEGTFQREFGRKYQTKTISRRRARELLDERRYTIFNNEITKVALADLDRNLDKVDIYFEPKSKIAIVPSDGALRMSYEHLTRLHYMRIVNKILLRAYGSQSSGTINEKQVLAMLTDLKPIFDLLKFDIRGIRPAVKPRLFEASIFLPHSDGRLSLNMDEAMELESVFLSVLKHAPDLHRQIAKVCDSAGLKKISPRCYQRTFAYNIGVAWKGTPGLADALEKLPMNDRAAMIADLDTFLRKNNIGGKYSEGDTKSFVQVGYYIEFLFYRFDRNHDGVFDQNEAKRAYPLFQSFIAQKANKLGRTTPEEHYKIFTYILAKQKVPSTFFEKLDYLSWKAENPFTIDRVGVMGIFSTLLAF